MSGGDVVDERGDEADVVLLSRDLVGIGATVVPVVLEDFDGTYFLYVRSTPSCITV